MIVVPGRFGVSVHHPNLDENENSVWGVQIALQLSENLGSFV
jgi:glutaminase